MKSNFIGAGLAVFLCAVSNLCATVCAEEVERSREEINQIKQAVIDSFAETHDGWSTDELLIRDELREKFLARCRELFPDGKPFEFNWTLLNLRKANRLTSKATKRSKSDDTDYRHAAEIAARSLHDRDGVSADRILADPDLLKEFDEIAQRIAGDEVSVYELRKAALRLRKARQLRPELILRIADWGREIKKFTVADVTSDFDQVPETPGIYIFFDETGYLYIGESLNLRQRLTKHLDESDSKSLAAYLKEHSDEEIQIEIHAFDPESQAKSKPVRRAYESELIRSRKPRLNLAP